MLGGGTFTAQNKPLPGAYINFVSLAAASAALSGRGIATMPLELDWGVSGEVFEVSSAEFQKNSMKLFGYHYTDEKLKGVRDLLKNITTLYAYRLNGGGQKASGTLATAKYAGTRGNDIKIVTEKSIDDTSKFVVKTLLGTTVVDAQTVSAVADLVANDYVVFGSTGSLAEGTVALNGGTNATVDVAAHQAYLDIIESYSYNAMGVVTNDDSVKDVYVNFCKRMRDEVGAKFQVVLYGKAADYEGVINVKNGADLVYWVTGAVAGCAVNKTVLNKLYDGEYAVTTNYTQTELAQAIKNGEFVLHKVGADVRVLEDINSLVTTTDTKGDIFKDNQTVRVIDQIANDIAVLFNTKYLGTIPNDEAGRISLWADIVKHHAELQSIRAIEDFSDEDVIVERGIDKRSVVVTDAVTIVNAMAKLYMTVTIA